MHPKRSPEAEPAPNSARAVTWPWCLSPSYAVTWPCHCHLATVFVTFLCCHLAMLLSPPHAVTWPCCCHLSTLLSPPHAVVTCCALPGHADVTSPCCLSPGHAAVIWPRFCHLPMPFVTCHALLGHAVVTSPCHCHLLCLTWPCCHLPMLLSPPHAVVTHCALPAHAIVTSLCHCHPLCLTCPCHCHLPVPLSPPRALPGHAAGLAHSRPCCRLRGFSSCSASSAPAETQAQSQLCVTPVQVALLLWAQQTLSSNGNLICNYRQLCHKPPSFLEIWLRMCRQRWPGSTGCSCRNKNKILRCR